MEKYINIYGQPFHQYMEQKTNNYPSPEIIAHK